MKAWHSASPYREESRMRDLQLSGHFLKMICCVADWIDFTSKCSRHQLPCLCTSINNDLGPFVFENSMPEIIWFEENFVIMLKLKKNLGILEDAVWSPNWIDPLYIENSELNDLKAHIFIYFLFLLVLLVLHCLFFLFCNFQFIFQVLPVRP